MIIGSQSHVWLLWPHVFSPTTKQWEENNGGLLFLVNKERSFSLFHLCSFVATTVDSSSVACSASNNIFIAFDAWRNSDGCSIRISSFYCLLLLLTRPAHWLERDPVVSCIATSIDVHYQLGNDQVWSIHLLSTSIIHGLTRQESPAIDHDLWQLRQTSIYSMPHSTSLLRESIFMWYFTKNTLRALTYCEVSRGS